MVLHEVASGVGFGAISMTKCPGIRRTVAQAFCSLDTHQLLNRYCLWTRCIAAAEAIQARSCSTGWGWVFVVADRTYPGEGVICP